MVSVKVIENILENNQKTFSVQPGITVEEIIRSNTNGDAYSGEMVECYDCDTGETFYAPISCESDTSSLSVLVNGKDSSLDYAVKDNDVVVVVYLPMEDFGEWWSDTWNWTTSKLGAIGGALFGAAVGWVASGFNPFGALVGAIVGGVVGFFAGGLVGGYIVNELEELKKKKNGRNSSGLESDKLPDVRGAQNQPLINNVFPFVMGKALTTPFIIGSPYNEIYGSHGEEIYINALFLVGYAPLRITDLKIGEQMLAHNQPWAGNEDLSTIYHGMLWGINSDDGKDIGEIVSTWHDNDIIVEILQQGQNGQPVDYGTVYPYSVIQDEVSANVLFIVDNNLNTSESPFVSYKGALLKNGLRNNPVKMTRQYPLSARIELDAVQGAFKTYTSSDDDGNSRVNYEQIPLWMGLQWRVYSKDNQPSDGDKSGVIDNELSTWWDPETNKAKTNERGWHSFELVNGALAGTIIEVDSNCTGNVSGFVNPTIENTSNVHVDGTHVVTVSLPRPQPVSITIKIILEETISGTLRTKITGHGVDGWVTRYGNEPILENRTKCERDIIILPGQTQESVTVYSSISANAITKGLNKTLLYKKDIQSYDYAPFKASGTYSVNLANFIVNGAVITKNQQLSSENFVCEENFSINRNETKSLGPVTFNCMGAFEKTFDQGLKVSIYDSTARTADRSAHTGNSIPSDINSNWIDSQVFNFQSLCGTWENQKGINEFRIVAEVNFEKWARENFTYTDEDDFINQFKEYFFSSSNTTKSIEVRVVRISPNYIDQTSGTKHRSADSFTDIISWTTLTSTLLDGDKLMEEGVIEQKRPLSESDMRKFCVISLRAKTDKTDQLSNILKKFNCMAQSFAPYYDSELRQWFPKNVEPCVKYFKPDYVVNNKLVRGVEITESQFIEDRQNGIKSQKKKDGNDFTKNLIENVIRTNSHKDSQGRYFIPSEEEDSYITETIDEKEVKLWNRNPLRYIENNVASNILLAGLGRQVGVNALSYEDYDLSSLSRVFEFCKAVRDGNTYNSDGYHYDHEGKEIYHNKGDEVIIYFTANAYVYEAKKLEDIIASLSFAARSVYTKNRANKLTFIIDKKENYHVALINQANTLSSSYTLSYADLPSGLLIPFKDENDGYEQNNIYAMRDGESKDDHTAPIEQYAFDYVTDPYQVWSLGRYLLANRIMNREIVVKKIGMEGASIGLGNLVCIQDDTMLIGSDYGGRITKLIEDNDYIYGFLINNTYHVSGELSSAEVPHENTLSAPLDFPYTTTKSGSTIRFLIPSGSEITDDFTANALVSYADETSEAKELSFVPVKVYDNNPDKPMYVWIDGEDNLAGTNGMGTVLRTELSSGVQSWIEDNDIGEVWARFWLTYKWYKNSSLLTGETGNICRIYEPGEYKVVVKLGVWYDYEHYDELTFSYTKTVVNTDENTGYCSYPTKSVFFIPVDDNDETLSSFSASTDIKLYKNKTEIYFGIERFTYEDRGQGCVIMQPSQYKESRIINLRLAPLGTTIGIDGEPFTVKKGESNVVVLADKISKNDITSEGGVVYVYKPQVDNIIGFGEIGKESALYRVIKIKPDNKHNYELTLLKYQPELYEYGRQLPSFQNNISRKQEETDSYNLSGSATAADLSAAIKQASDITVARGLTITAPDGTVFKNGQPASLTIEAQPSGYTPDTYQWYKQNGNSWDEISGATTDSYTITYGNNSAGVYKCVAENETMSYEAYITITAVSDGADGQDGGHQSYIFAVGAFGLDDTALRQLTWYDAPPTVPSGQCLYMATKWIDGE